jgi:5-methylcytosine-specific restriction endonuclease McrA
MSYPDPRTCELAFGPNTERRCVWCGGKLTGRRTRWCSEDCVEAWGRNHWWGSASRAARKRDAYTCRECGGHWQYPKSGPPVWAGDQTVPGNQRYVEVHHIEPRRGTGYGSSCGHHLDNLLTLCARCHLRHTTAQRATPVGADQMALDLPTPTRGAATA